MTNELARAPQPTLAEQMQYAESVAKAGILPQAYRNKPADIIVAIGLGQSMGLSAMESLYRINVIGGKPTASGELIASQVRKAGHRLRISVDEKRMSATCTIYRADDPEFPFEVTRDKAWADRMGLSGKDNYKKQLTTMLKWRAVTACARDACPEALYGVAYTPDEIEDIPPVPVEHTVIATKPAPAPEPRIAPDAVDLEPIRMRFSAFRCALGLSSQDAMREICGTVGKASMDEIAESEVDAVCDWMDARVAQANVDHEVEQAAHASDAEAVAAPEAPASDAYQPELLSEEVSW